MDYSKMFILTDMDGTLLHSDKYVSVENRQAIEKFTAQGGTFALATGRTPDNAEQYYRDLPVNAPSVFYNGALLYDTRQHEKLRVRELRGDIWRFFAEQCQKKYHGICLEVYTAEECYIITPQEFDDPVLQEEKQHYVHRSLAEIANLPWLKILVCGQASILTEIEKFAKQGHLDEVANIFYSSSRYLEFVAPTVSKGEMLYYMRNLPMYRDKIFVATGDYPNDNAMLLQADFSIAPQNARSETKQYADVVGCSCDENLLAYIINTLLPKYLA